ncbi:hypothetical protein [Roseovarius sp. MMSF_3281]|uniref:hypothetical protein n=1 Tax=Roseovarius sp. MMSF_3281 TaxID=3046694 RepID=UPI00273D14D2|nr:hypothetical protein [Roseovarius sp. MMSF_3281]
MDCSRALAVVSVGTMDPDIIRRAGQGALPPLGLWPIHPEDIFGQKKGNWLGVFPVIHMG